MDYVFITPVAYAKGRYRLRTYLVMLVVVALVPTLGLAILGVWQATDADRRASVTRLSDSARALARSVESDLVTNTTLLRTFSAASTTHRHSIGQLQNWLDIAEPGLGNLYFLSPNSTEPEDVAAESPPAGFVRYVMDRPAQGKPVFSNLYFTGTDNAPKIAIGISRSFQGKSPQVLSLVLSPDRLIQLAPQIGPTESSLLIAVVDGTGRILARSRDSKRYIGRLVPDWDKLKSLPDDENLFQAKTAEGSLVIFSYETLAGTPGWVLVVGEPLNAFNARWKKPLAQIVIGGGIALLAAFLLTGQLTRYILRPLQSLARDARKIVANNGHNDIPEFPEVLDQGFPIMEFESLRESIVAAQAALQQSALQERLNAQTTARSELRYRTLAQTGALVLWRAESGQGLTSATGWSRLTGEPEEYALRWRWLKRVHPEDKHFLRTCLARDTYQIDCEFRIVTASGKWHWVRARGSMVLIPSQKITEWVGVLEDVNERRLAQDRVAYMALHDELTGLPNRSELKNRLEMAIQRAGRGEMGAVLFLDLDRFKEVNDTLGHPIGDALLQAVTQRLLAQARDIDVVARLGGDEFVVVCSRVSSHKDMAHMAARIIDALGTPFHLRGHQIAIGASVGIMMIANGNDDAAHLLKCADTALYRAKREGRGRYSFFDESLRAVE